VGVRGVGLIFARELDLSATNGLAGAALVGAAVLFAAGPGFVERALPVVGGAYLAAGRGEPR